MPAKAKLTTRERTTSNVSSDNLNKGSELSFAEADSNFINLRDQSIAISDGSTTTDIEAGETITFSGASVSGNTVTITGGGGDIGNLQVNDTRLEPITTNDDLILDANGTGAVIVDSSNFYVNQPGDSGAQLGSRMRITPFNGVEISHEGRFSGDVFTVYGAFGQEAAYRTPFEVKAGNFNSGGSPSNTDGQVYINGIKFPTGPGSNGQYLQTNGTDEYSWATIPEVPSIGDLTFTGSTVSAPSNADLTLQPGGTGNIVLDGLNWPTADGTNGQFLITDGAGNLSFSSTSLTTFGDLTAVGSTITAPSNADLTLATSGSGDLVSAGNHRITGDLEVDVIRPEAAGNDIHILGLDVDVSNRSYVKVEGGAQAGVWIKGAAEISFDTSDTIGSGNSLHIGELFTRFNKGGNDTQNIFVHNNSNTSTTHGLLHIETYRNTVTINDSGIALNGSSNKFEGQGTENFNVFGTARLDNVFFKDNKIYTNQSNEDLELECSGTGTIDLKLPTSSTIGSNGGASALTANPVGYVKVKINGTEYQIPYYNV